MDRQQEDLYRGLVTYLMKQRSCDDTLKNTQAHLRARGGSLAALQFQITSHYGYEAVCDCKVMAMMGMMLTP